jgi:hypothetical protein
VNIVVIMMLENVCSRTTVEGGRASGKTNTGWTKKSAEMALLMSIYLRGRKFNLNDNLTVTSTPELKLTSSCFFVPLSSQCRRRLPGQKYRPSVLRKALLLSRRC